jgi:hypothetical protein
VTASFGCAIYPETATDGGSLIKAADLALFNAKRSGRNRTVAYDGTFSSCTAVPRLELERVAGWVKDEKDLWLVRRFESQLSSIAQALNLSPSQGEILRALLTFYPTYRTLIESEDFEAIGRMEMADEFRLLLPSLHAQSERYDGKGKMGMKGTRIPLLGRVLSILEALATSEGEAIVKDSGRFDPEIVAMMVDLHIAA